MKSYDELPESLKRDLRDQYIRDEGYHPTEVVDQVLSSLDPVSLEDALNAMGMTAHE